MADLKRASIVNSMDNNRLFVDYGFFNPDTKTFLHNFGYEFVPFFDHFAELCGNKFESVECVDMCNNGVYLPSEMPAVLLHITRNTAISEIFTDTTICNKNGIPKKMLKFFLDTLKYDCDRMTKERHANSDCDSNTEAIDHIQPLYIEPKYIYDASYWSKITSLEWYNIFSANSADEAPVTLNHKKGFLPNPKYVSNK